MKWDCNGTLVHWGRKLEKGGVLKSSFTFPLSQEQKATMPNYGRIAWTTSKYARKRGVIGAKH
jgi:hypothetical protein